jgi:hypothetical protein
MRTPPAPGTRRQRCPIGHSELPAQIWSAVHVAWHDEVPPVALTVPQHVPVVQSLAPVHMSAMPVHEDVLSHELMMPASTGCGVTQQTMPVPQAMPPHSIGRPPSNPPPLLLPLPLEPPPLLLLPLAPLLLPLAPPLLLLLPLPDELLLELHAMMAAPNKPIPNDLYKIRAFMKASLELPARNVVCSRLG